jgi:hypothetical protein
LNLKFEFEIQIINQLFHIQLTTTAMGETWSRPNPANEILKTVERLGGSLFPGCGHRSLKIGTEYIHILDLELINTMRNVKDFFVDTALIQTLSEDMIRDRDLVLRQIEHIARSASRTGTNMYVKMVENWCLQPVSDLVDDAPTAERQRCLTEATAFVAFLAECDSSGFLDATPTPHPFGSPRIAALAVKHGQVVDRTLYDSSTSNLGATYNWLIKPNLFLPQISVDKLAEQNAKSERLVTRRRILLAETEPLEKAARAAVDTPQAAAASALYQAALSRAIHIQDE